jgi:hypothetical protein
MQRMNILDLDKTIFGAGLNIKSCNIKSEFSKSISHQDVLRNTMIITNVMSAVFHDGTLPIYRVPYHTYSV